MQQQAIAHYPLLKLLLSLVFVWLVYAILSPFLYPLVWAGVLTVCVWPLNRRMRLWSEGRFLRPKNGEGEKVRKGGATLAAALVTCFLIVVFVGLLTPLLVRVSGDLSTLLDAVKVLGEDKAVVARRIIELPTVGPLFNEVVTTLAIPPESVIEAVKTYQSSFVSLISKSAQGIGGAFFTMGVTLFITFFLLKDGDSLAAQARKFAKLQGGDRYAQLLDVTWNGVRAVLYGVVVAAVAQGALAGIGFYIFGAPVPLVLGGVTILLGFIPFGPPLLYVPVAGYLLLHGGEWYQGIGLLVWGIGVISAADNVIRPIFISQATNLPILFSFFGALGGIAAFGMVGLFIGPVILALMMTLWEETIGNPRSHEAL